MKKITLRQRLRYEFDNTMSRGTISLIGWLAIVTLLLVIVVSLFLTIVGAAPSSSAGGQPGFGDTIWLSLKHAFNTGTVWGDTGTFPFMLAMFVVSFGGIFHPQHADRSALHRDEVEVGGPSQGAVVRGRAEPHCDTWLVKPDILDPFGACYRQCRTRRMPAWLSSLTATN